MALNRHLSHHLSDMPGIRADLFLAIFKTGIVLLTYSFFDKRFTILVPSWPRFEKVDFSTFFKVR